MKALRIIIGVVVVSLVVAMCWLELGRSEPEYQGQRLGQYLDNLATNLSSNVDDPSVKAIYQMGPRAIPYLRSALRKKDSIVLKWYAETRPKLPKGLRERLPPAQKPEYLARLAEVAAECLATFGPVARPAMPDLLQSFKDGRTANAAFYAVLQIGPKPEDLPMLLALLRLTNVAAPLYAADCIGKVGVTNEPVLSTLMGLAEGEKLYLREHAIHALGELGPKAEPAIPLLTRNLTDTNPSVRIGSTAALERIQSRATRTVSMMTKALSEELDNGSPPSTQPNIYGLHEEKLLRITALLVTMGTNARPAIPLLYKVRSENPILLKLMAAEALWKIKNETNGLEPICIEGIEYFDRNVQMHAAQLLADVCIQEHHLRPGVNEMLASKEPGVRFHAARAIWEVSGDTEKAIPILVAGLQDHFSPYNNQDIRKLAADTLGKMGPKAKSAIPVLTLTLKDGTEVVRVAATNALNKIEGTSAGK